MVENRQLWQDHFPQLWLWNWKFNQLHMLMTMVVLKIRLLNQYFNKPIQMIFKKSVWCKGVPPEILHPLPLIWRGGVLASGHSCPSVLGIGWALWVGLVWGGVWVVDQFSDPLFESFSGPQPPIYALQLHIFLWFGKGECWSLLPVCTAAATPPPSQLTPTKDDCRLSL